MEIEIRINSKNLLSDAIKLDCDLIGFGSESCVHLLPTKEELLYAYRLVKENGLKFRYVTPWVPSVYLDKILKSIEALNNLNDNIYVTINDWGVLYALQRFSQLNLILDAGRIMIAPAERCPWIDQVLKKENEIVRKSMFLRQSNEIDLLKSMGIRGFELDMLQITLKNRIKYGIDDPLLLHLDKVPVSIARSCHTAHFYNLKPPACRDKCNKGLKIEQIVEIYDISPANGNMPRYVKADKKTIKTMPKLWLYGNMIFREPNMKLEDINFDIVDTIILDMSRYSKADLTTKINKLKMVINGGK